MNSKTLSIIIPAYNEEKTIETILNKLKEVELDNNINKELIVINDASKDNTEQVVLNWAAENPDALISYYKHEKNKGKGAALHTGIKESKGDYVVIQDADLEYDPNEFNRLLKPIVTGFADVVYGSRFI
ncbi:MAG TPA: glycosyltransferase family 2 protein, partial [Saprospiraceae bacterium]|nr:glycosyltransferase family 2 protein [Saprospiraceae bacterium]